MAKPAADFHGTPRTGSPPLSVGFHDDSTNTPTSWAWDFGDGGTASTANPTHVYSTAGTYNVTLTATNAAGSGVKTKTYYVTVGAVTPSAAPDGRFLIAFNDDTLEPVPAWTRIDSYPNLVASYQIDRGRQYELDRTDVGRATVTVTDPDGILDPTNPDGPYFGLIEPLLQAMIRRRNPVTGTWDTRFRGFIEEMDYQYDPSQKFNRLTLTLIDIFEILNAIKMFPGEFGDPPPDDSADQVFFDNANMDDRILQVIGNSAIPPEFAVVFSGNVRLAETVYSPGESAMTAVQEAADAEFPGVSNVFTDRFGRLAVHGRLAKFDPSGVLSHASVGAWDWHEWHTGDGAAVNAAPSSTAHIRRFSMNRGLAKVINSALATPHRDDLTATEIAGQTVRDTVSIARFGIRSQEWQNLLTQKSLLDGADDLVETKRFAEFYVTNYAQPENRVTEIAFRSMRPEQTGAAANWLLLQKVDVSDLVHVTVASPGGGGLTDAQFYVEGVHETVTPLNPDYDNVDLTLDLSPVQYFADVTMWPEPG